MPKVVKKPSFNFTDFATLVHSQTLYAMKLTHPFDLASFQKRLLASPLRFLLIPFSWLYAAVISIRNRLYALGMFKARTLPCRVISVGNITVGGTGKTPAVIALAKHLQTEKVRVAILLRGYKRQSREKVTIVSDGERVCASLKESGDEAYMMAKHLSGIPIIVSRQRYQAGQVALERFGVDVLLLDDGFQHRQLARDVDILTVPVHSVVGLQAAPEYPFAGKGGLKPHLPRVSFKNRERLLPAGTLREPSTALRRADVILLTHTGTVDMLRDAKAALRQLAPNALILESVHQPVHFYPLRKSARASHRDDHDRTTPVSDPDGTLSVASPQNAEERDFHPASEAVKGKRILAVCGIGNPDAFATTLMQCSAESVELLAFPDHHVYTEADFVRIDTVFQAAQADLIVTTQKDEQKLGAFVGDRNLPRKPRDPDHRDGVLPPIFVLEVALVITEGVEKLLELLDL